MRAAISSTVYDFSGYVELDLLPEYTDGEVRRRVNRVATLDGSAVVNDGGFSDADRTFELRWRGGDAATEEAVERMVRTHGEIVVSTRSGVFLAAPEAYVPRATESTLRLLVLSKLSA